MIDELVKRLIGGGVRMVIVFVGGFFVSRGWLSEDSVLEISLGAAAAVVAWVWSIFKKIYDERMLTAAQNLPQHTSREEVKKEAEVTRLS